MTARAQRVLVRFSCAASVAVEEGRKVLLKYSIQYLLILAYGRSLYYLLLPHCLVWDVLQPVHLLWINLVTDTLPAIALPGLSQQNQVL